LLGLGLKTAVEFKIVAAAVVISVLVAATIMMVMSIVFIATHIGLLSFATNQNIGSC
jgi:hypothetical protein